MSYPSQPSYTPPYGQPQPPRQTNLWLVGGTIIVVVAIILTVTLVIFQRATGSDEGDGGDLSAGGDQSSESEQEEPTADEPTEDEPTGGDDGGDTAGEYAGFDESTCEAFDMTKFTELYEATPDPDETYTSASSSGDTGNLSCTFYSGFDTSTVSVMAWSDASGAMGWWEDDKAFWEEEPDYELTELTDLGDAGYHLVFGEEGSYQKRSVSVVSGALEFEVDCWISSDQKDPALADEYLQDMGEQILTMFTEYA